MNLQDKLNSVLRTVPDFPRPGIMFKDITPLFENPQLCREVADEIGNKFSDKIDAIAGIESRGFFFGFYVAQILNIPFVPIRKAGKLPYKKDSASYDLEYGSATIEMHQESLSAGMRVLIHDDLLATGGTAEAAAKLVKMQNANVAGFSFIIALNFLNGNNKLKSYSENIHSIIQF
jgi:adenine phosphoribosyltransferase